MFVRSTCVIAYSTISCGSKSVSFITAYGINQTFSMLLWLAFMKEQFCYPRHHIIGYSAHLSIAKPLVKRLGSLVKVRNEQEQVIYFSKYGRFRRLHQRLPHALAPRIGAHTDQHDVAAAIECALQHIPDKPNRRAIRFRHYDGGLL